MLANPYAGWSLDDLIEFVTGPEWPMPVRALEAVLEHGAVAAEPLRNAISAASDLEEDSRFWPIVLLGELRDGAAVPHLVSEIRRADQEDMGLSLAAADALGRIGAAAVPALRELARSDRQYDRLWAYYAAGCNESDQAYTFLLAALQEDPEMADISAIALADHGRRDAVPALLEAMREVEPWQRIELESTIRKLHGLDTEKGSRDDWRIRYRWCPGMGFNAISWAVVASIVRDDMRRGRTAMAPQPLRSLEEILAEPDTDPPRLCECCGVPLWFGTGVPTCPATAAELPVVQAALLDAIRDEEDLEDLFDVLDLAEDELYDLDVDPKPRGRRAREHRKERLEKLSILHCGCIWLIENGIATIDAGIQRLGHESRRAAAEHGDPMGVTFPDATASPMVTITPKVGRNDPCPCGSGRKYKKCCAERDAAAALAPTSNAESMQRTSSSGPPGVFSSFPRLATFDGEELSFCRAHYWMKDRVAVQRALDACEAIDKTDEPDRYVWLMPVDDLQSRVLGSITLVDDHLGLECMSAERLDRGKVLLEALAGDWLEHRTDTHQDPIQAMVVHRKARDGGFRPPPPSTPEETEVVQEILARHYRTWPDEPLPALDGKTARECARDNAGRQRVASLLAEMEAMEQAKPAPLRFDFTALWDELRITHLR